MKASIFFAIFSLIALSVHAKDRSYSRNWLGVFGKKNIAQDVSFWEEVQFRYDLNEGQMQQTLVRFGLLKNVTPKQEIGALMGFIQTGITKEYRPTFQHMYNTSIEDELHFNLRSRLEFRDVEDVEANSIRYRLLASARKKISSRLSPLIWDELFVNLTNEDWTGDRTFERNRFFAGIRVDESYGRWEVGYLNQFVPRKNQDTLEHVLVLYFFY